MYAVTVTIVVHINGYERSTSLPTFYLDPNVQGIVDEHHAKRIARDIVDPLAQYDEVHIVAIRERDNRLPWPVGGNTEVDDSFPQWHEFT